MSHCHFPLRNHKEITLGGVLVTSNFTPMFLSSISIPSQQPSETSSLAKIQGRDLSHLPRTAPKHVSLQHLFPPAVREPTLPANG